MNISKKFWCFTCNSECQINIIKEDDDEEYQCTKCKNTFIEEISKEDNPQNFHIEQSQQNISQNNNIITNYSISISSINTNNENQPQTQNQSQAERPDEYGMNDTLLFLPSTVNYIRRDNPNIRNSLFNYASGEIVTEILGPNNHNVFISRNFNNNYTPILGFLSNHNNDTQFESLLNIIMSFDSIHKGNPPASERAINNLKKIEINKNNVDKFNEEVCNVCLEMYKEGQISIKLDCGHCFHEACIVQWLKMRNTCPVCRHELESNDPNYEKRKHSHRETLRNLHSNFGNNNNGNGNNNNGGAESSV